MNLVQIDRADLPPATTLAIYRVALRWAAARGTSFELLLDLDAYDDLRDRDRLLSLGQRFPGRGGAGTAVVRGVPDASFVEALTAATAPAGARSGDECPVEIVTINAGTTPLFHAYDYGTVLVLDVDATELADLQRALQSSNLPAVSTFPIAPRRSP